MRATLVSHFACDAARADECRSSTSRWPSGRVVVGSSACQVQRKKGMMRYLPERLRRSPSVPDWMGESKPLIESISTRGTLRGEPPPRTRSRGWFPDPSNALCGSGLWSRYRKKTLFRPMPKGVELVKAARLANGGGFFFGSTTGGQGRLHHRREPSGLLASSSSGLSWAHLLRV